MNLYSTQYAPIVLFVYNRVDHTRKVIEALSRCKEAKESVIYIISDGAANDRVIDDVNKVRAYIKTVKSLFSKVEVIERKENWGIEKSEITTITEILDMYENIIVLEDDIEVSSSFLEFINYALIKYKDEKNVFSITGYSFIQNQKDLPKYAFTKLISAWGWATWKDRWAQFDNKLTLKKCDNLFDRKIRENFDCGFVYSDMLYFQLLNEKITWDIAWYWSSFYRDGLTLFPTKTMVNNIGMDGTGVHYNSERNKNRIESLDDIFNADELPIVVQENIEVRKKIYFELEKLSGGRLYHKIMFLKNEIKWLKRYYKFKGRKNGK